MADATSDTEVLFYHLERQPLEAVLPLLVEKTLQRGLRAVIQAGSDERLDALDEVLWTFRADSFLPHGRARDGHCERQPIFLTTGDDCPNGATIRFVVDGAEPQSYSNYKRIVILFDGNDSDALGRARAQWKAAKAAGTQATYWQQNESGRWERRA